jgi:large subunit ribosomal protein L21
MFAVVRTGGKQYRVAAGDKIVVEKLAGAAGDTIQLGDVLLAGEGSELQSTDGLTVSAEIIAQAKADKVIVFKKRRRHNYRRKKGHRQQHTILRITAIGDHKEAAAPAAAAQPQPASEAQPAAAQPESEGEPAPTKKPRAKKAPPAEAPLKVDGAESAMTDSPVGVKADAEAPTADAPQPQAPLKNDGAESQMTDTPASDKNA